MLLFLNVPHNLVSSNQASRGNSSLADNAVHPKKAISGTAIGVVEDTELESQQLSLICVGNDCACGESFSKRTDLQYGSVRYFGHY